MAERTSATLSVRQHRLLNVRVIGMLLRMKTAERSPCEIRQP
jgi:hypothetical protein